MMKIIARIYNDFTTKFGLPRQSGLAPALLAKIIPEAGYNIPDAFRGLDGYSHIWLIWGFSEAEREKWSPTVRPPRLGGNKRMGVFATRSPFRPNSIGLSSVKLEKITADKDGVALYVSGADLMNGTPIYDIKPYLPFTDCHTDAVGGFADKKLGHALDVYIPEEYRALFTEKQAQALEEILSQDPCPAYHNDPERVYGFEYAGYDLKFTSDGKTATVCGCTPLK